MANPESANLHPCRPRPWQVDGQVLRHTNENSRSAAAVTVNLRLLTVVKVKLLTFPGRAAPVWERSFLYVPRRCAPDAGSEATGVRRTANGGAWPVMPRCPAGRSGPVRSRPAGPGAPASGNCCRSWQGFSAVPFQSVPVSLPCIRKTLRTKPARTPVDQAALRYIQSTKSALMHHTPAGTCRTAAGRVRVWQQPIAGVKAARKKRQAQEATGAACQAAKNLAALGPVPRGRAEDSGRLDVTVHLRSAKGHAPHLMPGEP